MGPCPLKPPLGEGEEEEGAAFHPLFFPTQTNLPIFKLKDSCVRRRYSDFEWLKNELERDSKVSARGPCLEPPSRSLLLG